MLIFQLILNVNFFLLYTFLLNNTDYENFLNNEITKKNFISVSNFAKSIGLSNFDNLFNDFKLKYSKSYKDNNEEEMRKFYFMKTLVLIENNKQQLNKGKAMHKLAINKWADMSREELFPMHNDWSSIQSSNLSSKSILNLNEGQNQTQKLPQNFDWRDNDVVTDVKDQGRCGSCWAFAGIATFESAYAIQNQLKYPNLVEFSEQQVLDCAKGKTYYSHGCAGGTVMDVYVYAIKNGIVREKDYPYMKSQTVCRKVSKLWKVKLIDYHTWNDVDDYDIMYIIYNYGPVAAVINAGDDIFQYYGEGIITDIGNQTIKNGNTNHILTVIGWGVHEGIDYWIIKNSYGKQWGENGYLRLKRGINSRGFNTFISYPDINLRETNSALFKRSSQNFFIVMIFSIILNIVIIR